MVRESLPRGTAATGEHVSRETLLPVMQTGPRHERMRGAELHPAGSVASDRHASDLRLLSGPAVVKGDR